MPRVSKIRDKVLSANADANIAFSDLCNLLQRLGFDERIRGDHHIFSREGVAEILNLQPRGGKAKPYQVKQVRTVITAYRLFLESDDETAESPEAPSQEADKPHDPESSNGKRS